MKQDHWVALGGIAGLVVVGTGAALLLKKKQKQGRDAKVSSVDEADRHTKAVGSFVWTLTEQERQRFSDAYFELEDMLVRQADSSEKEALVRIVGNNMAYMIEAKDDFLKRRIAVEDLQRKCDTFVSSVRRASETLTLEQQRVCGFKAVEIIDRMLGNKTSTIKEAM